MRFKRYDSDKSSMDCDSKDYFKEQEANMVNNLIEEDRPESNLNLEHQLDGACNKELEANLANNLINEDRLKSNLNLEHHLDSAYIKEQEANLVNNLITEKSPVVNEVITVDVVDKEKHFEEQDVNWNEVNSILTEKRENKVYKSFQAKHLNKGHVTGYNPKRRLSPDEPDLPSKTLRTQDMVCASPKLRQHSSLTENVTWPRIRSASLTQGEAGKPKNRVIMKLRRRCNSVHNSTGSKKATKEVPKSDQKLITDMLKKEVNGQSE